MTKNEFLELAEKYEQGICSQYEEELIYEFCRKAQLKDLMCFWSLSEEEHTRIGLFLRINSSINEHHKKSVKKKGKKFIWAATAAMLIGVFALTYIYHFNIPKYNKVDYFKTVPVPIDAITLELADGSYQILEEGKEVDVMDKNGNPFGRIKGNFIIYEHDKLKDIPHVAQHTIRVPNGKKFNVQLSDSSIVHLNSGSSLRFPRNFVKGKNRIVELEGEGFFDVKKDQDHPFVLNLSALEVQVLGTSFNVSSYPEEKESEIVLVKGSVAMHAKGAETDIARSTILKPGFMGAFEKTSHLIKTEEVNTDIYTSWLNGNLIFRETKFSDILIKLERAYGIDIENKDPHLDNIIFNTNIDINDETLEQVLDMFGNLADFEYQKTTNGSIMINPKNIPAYEIDP